MRSVKYFNGQTESVGQLGARAQMCVCLYTNLHGFTDIFRDCSTALSDVLSRDVEVVNRTVNCVETWS